MSTSTKDDRAISKNRFVSISELLANPSAILEMTETDALLNCEVNPNCSSRGKD